jgi:hypothetical protein
VVTTISQYTSVKLINGEGGKMADIFDGVHTLIDRASRVTASSTP